MEAPKHRIAIENKISPSRDESRFRIGKASYVDQLIFTTSTCDEYVLPISYILLMHTGLRRGMGCQIRKQQ